jgi:hypothetical protein
MGEPTAEIPSADRQQILDALAENEAQLRGQAAKVDAEALQKNIEAALKTQVIAERPQSHEDGRVHGTDPSMCPYLAQLAMLGMTPSKETEDLMDMFEEIGGEEDVRDTPKPERHKDTVSEAKTLAPEIPAQLDMISSTETKLSERLSDTHLVERQARLFEQSVSTADAQASEGLRVTVDSIPRVQERMQGANSMASVLGEVAESTIRTAAVEVASTDGITDQRPAIIDGAVTASRNKDEILYKLSTVENGALDQGDITNLPEAVRTLRTAEPELPTRLFEGALEPVSEAEMQPTMEVVTNDEMVLVAFDELAVDTFEALSALDSRETVADDIVLEGDSATILLAAAESETSTVDEESVPLDVGHDFKTFVAADTEAEPLTSFAEIIDTAPAQPLEVTFGGLARYFSEKLEVGVGQIEADEAAPEQVIKRLLTEIENEINAVPVDQTLERSEQQWLTPEITNKLLELLQAVCYEQPQEALINFVRRYDLDYLLQAIRYLSQLLSDQNQPEFAPVVQSTLIDDDSNQSASARLGRMLLALLRMNRLATTN